MNRCILFLTGTRADFGKLKPLIQKVADTPGFDYQVFATGMHLLSNYGYTVNEIYKSGFSKVFTYVNQVKGENMEIVMANTVTGLSRYLHENSVDLIVVHGDRVEALAGAMVGALRNILVAHVEGGEVSGTVDELMRHSISKLSHLHFVANETARRRLIQLGEDPNTIFVIGSPDIDVMLSQSLPSLDNALDRYNIPFRYYGLGMLHPVTTALKSQADHADCFVDAMLECEMSHIVIYPNNDPGSEEILASLKRLEANPKFRLFPSLRFEYFLTLLKHSAYLIGNSSAGIHEAPIFGVPSINIGDRQHRRFYHDSIFNVEFNLDQIVKTVQYVLKNGLLPPSQHYGNGCSADHFIQVLQGSMWEMPSQKYFKDLDFTHD